MTVEDFIKRYPEVKADLIISEWMGYFLIYERMIDSIIYARDRALKPGGKLLPDKATIYLKPLCDYEYYK